jgi:hypothetical protein
MSVSDQFLILARSAEEVYAEVLDISKVEPIFEEVLLLITQHPMQRELFTRLLLEILHEPDKGPIELVSFCAHALQWEEFREELNRLFQLSTSERYRSALKQVISAFEDEWEDADMYKKFIN